MKKQSLSRSPTKDEQLSLISLKRGTYSAYIGQEDAEDRPQRRVEDSEGMVKSVY